MLLFIIISFFCVCLRVCMRLSNQDVSGHKANELMSRVFGFVYSAHARTEFDVIYMRVARGARWGCICPKQGN